MTSAERRARINELRETRRRIDTELQELNVEERREWQAQKLAGDPTKLDAEPWAEIFSYCKDLCYHAQRLGHAISGEFNEVPLIAHPDSRPEVIASDYDLSR